jgi:hypothetical protein
VTADTGGIEMSDAERPETRKETLRRILTPLNPKHNKKHRILALVLFLPGEFIIFCVIGMVFQAFALIARAIAGLIGEIPQLPYLESHYFLGVFCTAFFFFVPHFAINRTLIIEKKTDIFFEMSIALAAWAFYYFYMETISKRSFFISGFSLIYVFIILWLIIAEVIFYAVAFKRERAKIKELSA